MDQHGTRGTGGTHDGPGGRDVWSYFPGVDPAAAGGSLASLVAAANQGWRAENSGAAQRLIACYRVWQRCIRQAQTGVVDDGTPSHEEIDAFDVAAAYVVAAMPLSSMRAESMLILSADLHERYPAVLDIFTDGLIELRLVEDMARLMATVHTDIVDLVQQQVVDDYLAWIAEGLRPGRNAIRDRIDAIIAACDPDAIRQRRAHAARSRNVRIRKGRDGMASLSATLANGEAAVLAEAIDNRVAEHTAAESGSADGSDGSDEAADEHTIGDRRVDAVMSMAVGDTYGKPRDARRSPLRPQVTVIGGTNTGTGEGGTVEFTRTGQAALQVLLDMLATSDGATLENIDPTPGAADQARAALKYRPPAGLARRIRLRDGTCRHPGCHVDANACDIDHVIAFNIDDPANGGHTIEANLMCLCRRHHRFKTFSDWTYTLLPDGTLIVESPDGARITTHPDGPLGRYRQARDREEAIRWDAQQRRSPDPATGEQPDRPERSYWSRRQSRLNTERNRHTTGAGAGPTHRGTPLHATRWWTLHHADISPLEHKLHIAINHPDTNPEPETDTEPPPF